MEFTFWGTRGSIANATPDTMRYGGNTSCVEVRSSSGTLLVLDCGTGGYALGQSLIAAPDGGKRGHLLISHTHWDHIQGIPFFAPLFDKSGEWDIYAPHGLTQSLRETLAGQMNYSYSPITLKDLGANIRYHELVEGVFDIQDITVKTQFLNHPALTLGYRIEADDVSLVYACDHEPVCKQAIPTDRDLQEKEYRHIDFLRGADVVIHDTQYTADEYADKVGWGHSTVEYAVAVCIKAGVRKLVLTHHEPDRSDDSIDIIVEKLQRELLRTGADLQVVAAAERQKSLVEMSSSSKQSLRSRGFTAKPANASATHKYTVLLGSINADPDKVLRSAAKKEECHVLTSSTLTASQAEIDTNNPSLVIFDTYTPASEIVTVNRIIHERQAPQSPEVPVLFITYPDDPNAEKDYKEVATDWITWPFSEAYARAQIRAWILRTNCRWIRARKPADEERRLEELHSLNILHTKAEERFDRITRLAAKSLEVPIALISLVDTDTQWFKSCIGLDVRETSREVAFCAHAILERKPLVVPDTLLDSRFADNPLVTDTPHIRFYAGCPVLSANDYPLGTLCLIDTRPRHLDARQLQILTDLAAMVSSEMGERAA